MLLRVEQLPCFIERDIVVPLFLEEMDHPWMQRLIERALASEGIRSADIDEHLLAPLPLPAPPPKQRLAAFTLQKSLVMRTVSLVTPKDARVRLFAAAARAAALGAPRGSVLAEVAASFGVSPDELLASLFADLPAERVVVEVAEPPSPGLLAARANLWLAQAYVSRAVRVRIDVKGVSRGLVRSAKSKGLLCTISGAPDCSAAVLELSGPLSLFKNTRLYGSALASLLPALAWCDRWILDAECMVGARRVSFRLSTGAPILPSDPPKRFDSRVEERFAKEFAKKQPAWSLVREPRPVVVDDGLLFPDFALEPHGGGPAVFVELVGFWTPDYLEEKLARYRRARLTHLVLCVDEDLGCSEGALPEHARVVRFRGRVSVDAVLAAAESLVSQS